MISVVICSKEPAKLALIEAMYRNALGDHAWELIAITDAKSLAEGYNRGASRSRGEIVVFSHDDIEILSADLTGRLTGHLGRFDLVGVAGTRRIINASWRDFGPPEIVGQVAHPTSDGRFSVEIYGAPRRAVDRIQAIDGLFMAARRSLLNRIQFDAVTFDHFHCYDVDFSYQAYQAGASVGVACDINLLHHSPGSFDATWRVYATRFEHKWRGSFTCRPQNTFRWAGALVSDRAQALTVMTPSYWDD